MPKYDFDDYDTLETTINRTIEVMEKDDMYSSEREKLGNNGFSSLIDSAIRVFIDTNKIRYAG